VIKINRKTILSVLFILLIAVLVSGCGGSGGDNASGDLKITAINPIDDDNIINVELGTDKSTALPDSVVVTLSNNNTASLTVDWNKGEPVYEKNTANTYTFTGILDISGTNYANPDDMMISVDVVVGPQANNEPQINLNKTTNNLTATLTGNVTDSDGTVEEVTIDWGDGNTTTISSGFDSIDQNHIYNSEGTYDVIITAADDDGATVSKNLTITVNKPNYTLTINTEGEGTVNPEEGSHEYEEGTEVSLEANPVDGWEFVEWTGHEESTDNPIIFNMPSEDVELTAYFEKIKTAYFEVDITDYPEDVVGEGEEIVVGYTVENTGDIEGTRDIEFFVNNELVDSEDNLTLNAGETHSSEFIYNTTSEDVGAELNIEVASDDDFDDVKVQVIKIVDINEPNTFDLILKDEPSNGILHFTLENIMDAEQNIYTGNLIGENNILEIDYINSKIKFYWTCSGILRHQATLTFDVLGFNDNSFSDNWSTSFNVSNKFSDTIYEKDDKAYVKDEWFEFIKMIHNFYKYEVILSLSYKGERLEVSSGKLDYLAFEEFPTGSAYRIIMGKVSDENGNPIEGAKVLIWTETENQYWRSPDFITDENGEYGGGEVRLASESAHYITVEKDGYNFINKDIKIGVGAYHIRDGDATIYPESKIINFTLEKPDNYEIEIKDPNLEEVIRGKINKPEGTLYLSDVIDITKLYAARKNIESIEGIQYLEKLQELDFSSNDVSDISPLSTMARLKELNFAQNRVSDITPLANLSYLQSLTISDNQISDISILTDLTHLRELTFEGIEVSDISILADLTDLTSLNFSDNEISDISILADLTDLTSLNFSDNEISDISILADLTHLTSLNFSDNEISDISMLADLTNLRMLYISDNQISDISILADLTDLISLSFSDNQISDISPVSNLTNLQALDFTKNNVTDISPVSNLTNLQALDFTKNNVTDISPVSNLTNLKWFRFNDNRVSDISPVSNLTNLEWLIFNDNQVSDISPLVNNSGIDSGDEVDMRYNELDLTEGSEDMDNINNLIDRGVNVEYEPQN